MKKKTSGQKKSTKSNILEVLDNYLENKGKEVQRDLGRPWFRCSEAGDCSREIAYRIKGIKSLPTPPDKVRLLGDGDYHCASIKSLFSRVTRVIGEEKAVSKRIRVGNVVIEVRGHLDFISKDPVTKELFVVECKGINHFSFQELKKKGIVSPKYISQTQLYLYLSGIHKGLILIKNKNNSELYPHWIELDKREVIRLLHKFAHIHYCLQQNKLPQKEYQQGSKECWQCSQVHTCRGKRIIRENPYKSKDKVLDFDTKDTKGTKLLMAAELYSKGVETIKEGEKLKANSREVIDNILDRYPSVTAFVKQYQVIKKTTVRDIIDMSKINKSILPMKQITYISIEVRERQLEK